MPGFARMTARSLACALALIVGPLGVASAQNADQFPPAQLEAMVAPYLDLSTPVLAWVFSASKYPAAVADAAGALETPPTATVDPAQLPSSVRALMDSEPELLWAMADDMQGTATPGMAYQSQPGDVWDRRRRSAHTRFHADGGRTGTGREHGCR